MNQKSTAQGNDDYGQNQQPFIGNPKTEWHDDYDAEIVDHKLGCYSSTIDTCGACGGFLAAWIPCFCCVKNPYQRVQQSFEGIVEKFGKFSRTLKPGLHYVNPCTEKLHPVDLKTQIVDLANQVVLTRDNITISIDASVYFRIINTKKAVYRVANISNAVMYLCFSTLRNVAGQSTLQDFLEKRLEITDQIQRYVDEHVGEWGAHIDQVFIKDIILSSELQSSLSSAAKERRLAESKIISAKADVESARMMKESADILDSRPAMQIRYLDTIQQITKSNNSKVVFLPFDENAGTDMGQNDY